MKKTHSEFHIKFSHNYVRLLALSTILAASSFIPTHSASAASCTSCNNSHRDLHQKTRDHFDKEMDNTKEFMVTEWFTNVVEPGLKKMTAELNVVESQRTDSIGRFMDAKHEKETVTEINAARAQAQKQFTPNPVVGDIASQSRAIPASRAKSASFATAINARVMAVHTGSGTGIASRGLGSSNRSRTEQYRSTFCDPNDNGGLNQFCGSGGSAEMRNADISYSGLFNGKLTIDGVDAEDGTTSNSEEALYAMALNIVPEPLAHLDGSMLSNAAVSREGGDNLFVQSRAFTSKVGLLSGCLGQNFALFAEGDTTSKDQIYAQKRKEGYSDAETEKLVGQNPSVLAQYQTVSHMGSNPSFHTELAGMNEEQLARLNSSVEGMKSSLRTQIQDRKNCIMLMQAAMGSMEVAERQEQVNSAIRTAVRDVAEGN